jgi:AcrR family transcriptional regulator
MADVAEDLRRTVLDASLALVAEAGVGALSMREVARRAGVSHQAPYHHFKDRAAILAALAEEGYVQLQAAMRQAAAKGKTPLDRLEGTGRAYIRFALAHPALFKIMHQSELVQIEQHSQALTIAQSTFDMLVGIVEEAALAKNRALDRTELAVTAWCLVHGTAMLLLENRLQRKFPKSRDKAAAATEMVLATFSRFFK